MHRSRLTCAVVLIVMLGVSTSMTSCGGGSGGTNPDLVLLGFNVPNLSGIPLNQALIFTFSADINPQTITPDSLRVVGTDGPFFEEIVVDGNLVALLPTTPNFADYSDAGLQPDIEYTVSLTEFPAVTTIESVTGKPLLEADTFTFKTLPAKSADIVSNIRCNGPDGILGTPDDDNPASPSFFIETRRPIRHGTPWTQGGKGDDAGCLQNSAAGNELYVTPSLDPAALQTGTGPGARLLCLQNEGSPRVVEALTVPRHDTQSYGNPSAAQAGFIDLPAIRVKLNEPLDPLSVEPFFNGIPVNVQLWRVAFKDGTFRDPPDQIRTNKPIVVQSIDEAEIILVPAGPVPQGIYVINITPAVKDLAGCPLRINDRPDPAASGYDQYEAEAAFGSAISPGYRVYFKTLEVPDTPLSIIEDFNNNLAEWGDNDSGTGINNPPEPGLYSESLPDGGGGGFTGNPLVFVPGSGTLTEPFGERTYGSLGGIDGDPLGTLAGQSTTALWNGVGVAGIGDPIRNVDGYRFLNLPTLFPRSIVSNPTPGTLQAVQQPWAGNGGDGVFDTNGSNLALDTTAGSINGDGVYEFESFRIRAGDTVTVTGSKPLLVMCLGDFLVEGTLTLSGQKGRSGFDSDGSLAYTNSGAVRTGGLGGAPGPGGGAGGNGADTTIAPNSSGLNGATGRTMFDTFADQTPGHTGGAGHAATVETVAGSNDGSGGGGGGGYAANGADGTRSTGASAGVGGLLFGDSLFTRGIALFNPDRGYCNNSNVGGGPGGGGGSADDDNGASETGNGDGTNAGDDGGGGGGGGGGALWVFARGVVTVTSSGVINANGGVGGNTYGPGDQLIDPGPDANPLTDADNVFLGLNGTPAVASGDGGPGGGGSGGGIFLIGKLGVTVDAGGTVTALGGAGGTSDNGARVGGAGSDGRIVFGAYGAAPVTVNGTVNPVNVGGSGFVTPVELCSVAQSDWVDLFTNNTDFSPLVGGQVQVPTFVANFTLDLGDPGYLELPTGSGGGGQSAGTDFDAALEFQGADFLNDGDGNTSDPLVDTPTEADGLTQWFDVSMIDNIDGKRYVRWRWRFFAKDGYGTFAGDPPSLPLPTVFDVTIPFVKN